jgi:hypothetical protein
MEYSCSVFGLGVSLNLPLTALSSLPPPPHVDVKVVLSAMPPWLVPLNACKTETWYTSPYTDNAGEPDLKIWELSEGSFYHVVTAEGVEAVMDRSGSRLWVTWPDTLTLDDMAAYLLSPLFGILLRLRGVTCLHGSAIAVDDHAIAFVGPEGAGKSTTAAAFAESGLPVLSDDIVAILDQKNSFTVQPAYPRVRLWPQSVELLYGAPDALPLISPTWDKRYLDLNKNGCRFQEKPLPLACIYVLNERISDLSSPSFQALSARDGMMDLVANIYAVNLPGRIMRAREFEFIGRILDTIPLRQVTPCALSPVPELCDAIIEDFKKL